MRCYFCRDTQTSCSRNRQEGDVSDTYFFKNNSGAGKQFPGGPTCVFQGNEVPCLTRWSPKGSITVEILINILSTLDHLMVFDLTEGQRPFLLLNGYNSRFALKFLTYILDLAYMWVVCICVPYRTALWHVGGSSEQNGALNQALTRAKEWLIKMKRRKTMTLTIESYEIIPLIIVHGGIFWTTRE